MSDAQRAAVAHALSAPEDARTILRVSATAGEDEIRRAYRRACILLHPDKNPLPDAAAAFQRVERAKTAEEARFKAESEIERSRSSPAGKDLADARRRLRQAEDPLADGLRAFHAPLLADAAAAVVRTYEDLGV